MKEKFVNVYNNVKGKVEKHSPEILMGVGVAGVITSTVLACRATMKLNDILEASLASYAKVITSSYTGDGLYGVHGPVELQFETKPKLLIVRNTIFLWGETETLYSVVSYYCDATIKAEDVNTIIRNLFKFNILVCFKITPMYMNRFKNIGL